MKRPMDIHPRMHLIIEMLSKDNSNEEQEKILDILTDLVENYDVNMYPSYSKGLAGIGCGILYLLFMKYVEGDVEDVLSEFDLFLEARIYEFEISDFSHSQGILGIASYYFYRLEMSKTDTNSAKCLHIKTMILHILDLVLARIGVRGYGYANLGCYPRITEAEKIDIMDFAFNLLDCNICNDLVYSLIDCLRAEERLVGLPVYTFNTDVSDVTVVLPFKIDCNERLENLHTLLNYYTLHTKLNFLLLEVGERPVFDASSYINCSYKFSYSGNSVFHHTYYRNKLIKSVTSEIVLVWDVDIIVPLEQLYAAINDVRNNNITLCFPYNWTCVNLSKDDTRLVKFNNSIEELLSNDKFHAFMFGRLTVGGIFCVNKKKYESAGLDNEAFIGWGVEDMERLKRLTILGHSVTRITGSIFHLWHPRSVNSIANAASKDINHKQELFRICKMDRVELMEEVKMWNNKA